jgi:hypothetical protein
MEVIGWIAWGFTAYIALLNMISQTRDRGARLLMQRQGIIMAVCCAAVLLLEWNKLLTLTAIPVAMMLSFMMMSAKLSNARYKFMSALEESQRTGEPHRDILKRKDGIELPDND